VIRVVLAEDHHLVRQGIRALLEKDGEFEVIGEAKDGIEAVELTERLQPEVLILDITMPHLNGMEALKRIRALRVSTRVLMLSMHSDESLVCQAMRGGARGFLLKSSVAEELLSALRAACRGETFLGSEIPEGILDTALTSRNSQGPLERLTRREREVLQLLAESQKNAEIAQRLGISMKTVEKHRASLMAKLKVHDLAALVRFAIKHAVISLDN